MVAPTTTWLEGSVTVPEIVPVTVICAHACPLSNRARHKQIRRLRFWIIVIPLFLRTATALIESYASLAVVSMAVSLPRQLSRTSDEHGREGSFSGAGFFLRVVGQARRGR